MSRFRWPDRTAPHLRGLAFFGREGGVEKAKNFVGDKDAIALLARGFAEDADTDERVDLVGGRFETRLRDVDRRGNCQEGTLKEGFDQFDGDSGARGRGKNLFVASEQFEEANGAVSGVPRLFRDSLGEERNPACPAVRAAHIQKMIVVFLLVHLEEGAEVKERRGQDAAFEQNERNEESAQTAVAVVERMDRFELIVDKCEQRDERHVGRLAEKRDKIADHRRDRGMARRYETRVVVRLSAFTDEDGAVAQFAGAFLSAANAVHENSMEVFDESSGDWMAGRNALPTLLQGEDIVLHFLGIGRNLFFIGLDVEKKKLIEPRDGSFNLAGENRLTAQEWSKEQGWIGQQARETGEFADGPFRRREPLGQGKIEREFWRKRIGNERPVSENGADDFSRRVRRKVFGSHGFIAFGRLMTGMSLR